MRTLQWEKEYMFDFCSGWGVGNIGVYVHVACWGGGENGKDGILLVFSEK